MWWRKRKNKPVRLKDVYRLDMLQNENIQVLHEGQVIEAMTPFSPFSLFGFVFWPFPVDFRLHTDGTDVFPVSGNEIVEVIYLDQ